MLPPKKYHAWWRLADVAKSGKNVVKLENIHAGKSITSHPPKAKSWQRSFMVRA
jgi:hypothetical protein